MEPEPMPDDIVQQDILLDDIKEYRKIISGLMYHLQKNYDTSDECKTIYNEYIFLAKITPFNHHYGYIGYEPIYADAQKHKKYISELMNRIKNAGKTECDTIYNECYSSGIYQYYILENYNYQD